MAQRIDGHRKAMRLNLPAWVALRLVAVVRDTRLIDLRLNIRYGAYLPRLSYEILTQEPRRVGVIIDPKRQLALGDARAASQHLVKADRRLDVAEKDDV